MTKLCLSFLTEVLTKLTAVYGLSVLRQDVYSTLNLSLPSNCTYVVITAIYCQYFEPRYPNKWDGVGDLRRGIRRDGKERQSSRRSYRPSMEWIERQPIYHMYMSIYHKKVKKSNSNYKHAVDNKSCWSRRNSLVFGTSEICTSHKHKCRA